MFGMADPAQTIQQIERYAAEGRLEIAEVMATEFCQLMLTKHSENTQQLVYLVKGLRLLCSIFLLREKGKEGLIWIKKLHNFRKKLHNLLRKNAPELLKSLPSPGEDYHLSGNLYAMANKKSKARKMYNKSSKFLNHPLEVRCDAVLYGLQDSSTMLFFLESLDHHQGISRVNEEFHVMSASGTLVHFSKVKQCLTMMVTVEKFQSRTQEHLDFFEQEIHRIEEGERAANAQLEAALQNLQPKHDYYQYG